MTDKAESKAPTKVKPGEVTSVKEVPAPELKIQNPHLTIRVNVPGLDTYEKTGLRGPVAKTARAWIRSRGLSVQIPGVVTVETAESGAIVELDGEKVVADLREITFSPECILDAGATVNVPAPRQPKPKSEAKPKPDAKPKTPAATKPEPKAKEGEKPSDW